MQWNIPAKTFLLGEYVALTGGPAIVLTTTPCFEVKLTQTAGFNNCHKDSPAARFWDAQGHTNIGLEWHDPYQNIGGMGASSAQFLGAYLADSYIKNIPISTEILLKHYAERAYAGQGLQPSGYDLLAQMSSAVIVYTDPSEPRALAREFPLPNGRDSDRPGEIVYISRQQDIMQASKIPSFLQTERETDWGWVLDPSSHGCGLSKIQSQSVSRVFEDKMRGFISMQACPWPFQDIGFLLLHSGVKLATHHYLATTTCPSVTKLATYVAAAKQAFDSINSNQLIEAINAYHQELLYLDLVAAHSQEIIAELRHLNDVLAIKGCGALGADVLLLIVPTSRLSLVQQQLATHWKIIASSAPE